MKRPAAGSQKANLFGSLGALAATGEAQTVHVVDGAAGPGHDFTSVAAAVAAAADGDIVLIREGFYFEGVRIFGKTLVLQAEVDAEVTVGLLNIQDLAAGQYVAVRGVDSSLVGMFLRNNAGVVWIEDSVIDFALGADSEAVLIEDCRTVVFRDCLIDGLPDTLFPPLATLRAKRSSVHLFETEVVGMEGIPITLSCGTDGFAAIEMEEGSLWLYDSTVRGGPGFDQLAGVCGPGGTGGAGIVVLGQNEPVVSVLASTVEGGAGGAPGGVAGTDFDVQSSSGTVVHYPRAPRSHRIASPFRAGEAVQGEFVGEPGEPAWLFASRRPGRALELSKQASTFPFRTTVSGFGLFDGPLLLHNPRFSFAGMLDGTGSLLLDSTASVPGPREGIVYFAQGLHRGTAGCIMSSPTMVTFLDASF